MGENSRKIENLANDRSLQEALDRSVFISLLLTIVSLVYGFTSTNFIQRFGPGITLWDNSWPRILLTTLPYFGLFLFLRRSKVENSKKILTFFVVVSLVFMAAAWIHIWPIALRSNPGVMTYVHAANVFFSIFIIVGVAPPGKLLPISVSLFCLIFLLPLFAVVTLAGDRVILNLIIADSATAVIASFFLANLIDRVRIRLFRLEIEAELKASRFLGPVISNAIYKGEESALSRVSCKGFILSLDVRDSTELQKSYGSKWLEFRREYFTCVSNIVAKHKGYIQKTVGDAHVINFGIMDYGVDLSDIPGIENELARADDRRLRRASESAFLTVKEIFEILPLISSQHLGEICVRIGAGLDKGMVERGLQGSEDQSLELDVNGDAVNCSSRLQEYSKSLQSNFDSPGSILVVSPFAADYLSDLASFKRLETSANPIRNYPQIKWVLAKNFQADSIVSSPVKLVA